MVRPSYNIIVLGLAASVNTAVLSVYVIQPDKVFVLNVMEAAVHDQVLLATMSAGIRFLCKSPIVYPKFLLDHVPIRNIIWDRVLKPRVYVKDGSVHKLFDTNFPLHKMLKSNEELMKECGIAATKCNLSTDGKIFMVIYKFIDGNHIPLSVQHFRGIIEAVNKIHVLGLVHGDIRKVNMIFCADETSKLIDFDLVDSWESISHGISGQY